MAWGPTPSFLFNLPSQIGKGVGFRIWGQRIKVLGGGGSRDLKTGGGELLMVGRLGGGS